MSWNNNQDIWGRHIHQDALGRDGRGSESRVEEGWLETELCCSSRTQLPEKLLQCGQKHFPACLTGPRWHLPESSCWHPTRRRRAISLQPCKACLLMKCFVTSSLSERRLIFFGFFFFFFWARNFQIWRDQQDMQCWNVTLATVYRRMGTRSCLSGLQTKSYHDETSWV